MEKIQPAELLKDPIIDMSFGEASKELTGFDVIEVEKHYHASMENFSGVQILKSTVYALRKRVDPLSWEDVESLTLSQLKAHFASDEKAEDRDQGEAPSPYV